MKLYDLIIQIFMAASFIAGVTMLVFTLGYRRRLRRVERLGRYTLSILLVYSVTIRFLLLMPVEVINLKGGSIAFDILYIAMCLFYNISIIDRGRNERKK